MIIYIIFGIIVSYLIGSFPTAVLCGKIFYGTDVREHGSGNAGATNTFRVLGLKPGLAVMLIDVLKGWSTTYAATFLMEAYIIHQDELIICKLIFGISAVLGHIFPVYAKFQGGKGIASLLGMVFAIHIEAALICMGVFFIVFLLSKYVSLGSMIASLAFPIIIILFPRFNDGGPLVIIFGFAIFSIVILTHQKNIKRLINGEENKVRIRVRKTRSS